MLYSTFLYVLEALKVKHPGVPVEIVPGVSSVMAAAASSGTPLASHGESLAILPAAYGVEGLREAVASHDTVVLMKVTGRSSGRWTNWTTWKTWGWREDRVHQGASTDREQVVRDLGQLRTEKLDYFSLLIIRNSD